MEEILSTCNLTKQFKNQIAVNNVNLHIKKGEIYGLIGRNGAGKTTLMKMLGGLSRPTGGTFTIFGMEEKKLSQKGMFSKVGIMIETPGLFENMTAYDNLAMKCICCNITSRNEYINQLLSIVDLKNVNKKKVKNFSLGMKQRLGVAMALIGDPQILILDEPINGLDPQGIAEMRNIIVKLNNERKMTIIISSHILEELSKVVTSFGILEKGQLVYENTRKSLEQFCASKQVSLEEFYFEITGGVK